MVEHLANRPPTPSNRSTPPAHRGHTLGSSDSHGSSMKDPPRPAKEGFEWVWFPDGYWAERELQSNQRKASDGSSARLWKWRSHSSKSKSSSDDQRGMPLSPKTIHTSPGAGFAPVPPSPYLSEEAHVHALQNPSALRHERNSSIGSRSGRGGGTGLRQLPRRIGAAHSDPPVDATSAPPKGLLSTARRGLYGALWKGKPVWGPTCRRVGAGRTNTTAESSEYPREPLANQRYP